MQRAAGRIKESERKLTAQHKQRVESLDNSQLAAPDQATDAASQTLQKSSVPTKKGLRPLDLPFKPELPIEAWVEPTCVSPGARMVVHVRAPHEAAIAYHAVYSDGYGGSDPPMGAGYGGNDKGYAPESGEWASSWLVSPTAPPGPARVDVVVGHRAEYGYADPHFAVADEKGDCPKAWLRGSDQDEG